MKRVASIQDISCLGKCSLTVALPVISAMGAECAIVPTAVLSTHTMFPDFTCKGLTDQIDPIRKHWQSQNIAFDAIYTGYMADSEQISLVCSFFDTFRTEENLIVVDPAMADNGKLYPAFGPEFPAEMAKLCAKADVVLPNLTEACLMTGAEYREEQTPDYVRDILKRLLDMGAKNAVLTGASFEKSKVGVMSLDRNGREFTYFTDRLDASFHGTGDIFASTCVGALMNGFTLDESLKVAADYTAECIRVTMAAQTHNWYGVEFETATPYLLRRIGKC